MGRGTWNVESGVDMPDALGYRAKIGVLVPATNTIAEPEYHAMAPRGVTLHTGRFSFGQRELREAGSGGELPDTARAALEPTVRQVLACAPDHLIVGMSAPSYWGGRDGSAAFTRWLEGQAGRPVTTAAQAFDRALRALGARRLAILTPYTTEITDRVKGFFVDAGYDVLATLSMNITAPLSIAEVTEERLREALIELNRADAEVIVQSGTNLAFARLADEAERWLNKPVLAVNAATLWDALRRLDISDRIDGFGRLLREH